MISVTKDFTFDAAHFLEDYDGPCANLHGHTYQGSVTVGPIRCSVDMVIDFKELKNIIQDQIVDAFDHKFINNVVPYNPTAENMVADIADRLKLHLPTKIKLLEVKLWETPGSHATWGPD